MYRMEEVFKARGNELAYIKGRLGVICYTMGHVFAKNDIIHKRAWRLMSLMKISLASELDDIICRYYPMDINILPNTDIPLTSVFYKTEYIEYPIIKKCKKDKQLSEEQTEYINDTFFLIHGFLYIINNNELFKTKKVKQLTNKILKLSGGGRGGWISLPTYHR